MAYGLIGEVAEISRAGRRYRYRYALEKQNQKRWENGTAHGYMGKGKSTQVAQNAATACDYAVIWECKGRIVNSTLNPEILR